LDLLCVANEKFRQVLEFLSLLPIVLWVCLAIWH